MKHNRLPGALTAAIGAFLPGLGAAACLLTAFDLNGSFWKLFGSLLLFSLLCGFSLLLRHGSLIPLGVLLLVFGRLWYIGTLTAQFESLFLNITLRYRGAYGTGLLFANAENGPWGPVDLALLALGCLSVFLFCRSISRGKGSFLPILLPVLQLAACLVVTDTPPHPAALLTLLSGLLALLMTDHVRRRDPMAGQRLLRLASVPLALILGLVFLLQPQDSYVNQVPDRQERLLTLVQKFQGQLQDLGDRVLPADGPSAQAQQLDLRTLGPRTQWNFRVLEVDSPVTDTLYLRGQDFNTYTGTGWTASRHRSEVFPGGGTALGTLTIRAYSGKDLMYIPYYPGEDVTLIGGAAKNDNRAEYSFQLTAPPDAPEPSGGEGDISDLLLLAGSPSAYPDSGYRQLPTDTLRWAREITDRLLPDNPSVHQAALCIGDFVRASALYDLDTHRMDAGATDFARWFLEESDTGYCVHFATAATVLLRAANIPARYVEGYLVHAEEGRTTTVTGRSAHAWAEYYCDGIWHVLEATPADTRIPEAETDAATEADDTAIPTLPERPRDTEPSNSPIDPTLPPESGPALGLEAGKPSLLTPLLWLLGVWLVLWGQYTIRLRLHRLRWNRFPANQAALYRYRRCLLLSRLARCPVPEELEEAALKAKYSQHALSEGELALFSDFREVCLAKLQKHPIFPFLRFLFALDRA